MPYIVFPEHVPLSQISAFFHSHLSTTMPNPNSKELTAKLHEWLLIFLKTGKKHVADQQVKRLGTAIVDAKKIIIKRLTRRGSLEPAKSTGRPVKYDHSVMQRALALLEEHSTECLTLTSLLALLVEEGAVEEPVDSDNFSSHLRAYVRGIGMYINTTSTCTIFLLNSADYKERLAWCKLAAEELQRAKLTATVFIDETTLQASPHPKGKLINSPMCVITDVNTKALAHCVGIVQTTESAELCCTSAGTVDSL